MFSFRDSTLTQLLRSSLGGKSCTSVVIAVASDDEHAAEKAFALWSLASVWPSSATMRPSRCIKTRRMRHDLPEMLLSAARDELARLELDGHGEKFGDAEGPSAIAQFKDNVRRKAAMDKEALEARSMLAELRSNDPAKASALRTRAENAEAESRNLRDIILRQSRSKASGSRQRRRIRRSSRR